MSPYSLPALLAFAINISLVIILLLDNLKSRTHRLFALLIACFALWDVADIIVVNSSTPESASIGGGLIVVALLFASTFFVVLSFSFPVLIHPRFDRVGARPLFLILPLMFSVLSGLQVFQPLNLHRFTEWNVYCYSANESDGVLNIAMYAMVFLYLAWGIGNLVRQWRLAQSQTMRLQVIHVLLGALGLGILIVTLDVLHENQQLHFFASRGLFLLISFFFAYVVLGNRLLVLRRLGRHGLSYSIVTGLVFAFYLIVIKNIAEVLGTKFNVSTIVFETLLILALTFVFRPLVVRVQSLVDNFFYRNMFVRRQAFLRFSREAFHLTDLSGLTRAVVAFLQDMLSTSCADVMIVEENTVTFRSILDPQQHLTLDADVLDFLAKEHKAHEVAEVMTRVGPEDQKILEQFTRGYVVPLPAERGMVGLLLIGPTTSGKYYTLDEEEFLIVFANEVSIAVERNTVMATMRAQEARVAHMEKLAALGRLTAGIAHEFRNPLNVIATAAQTILRHPENTALIQETGGYIAEETQRLNLTVDAFLQFAKPHTPVWQRTAVADLIDRVVSSLEARSRIKGIAVTAEVSPSLPEVITSPQHIERALANLGDNAIEAMKRGGGAETHSTVQRARHDSSCRTRQRSRSSF